MKLSNTIDNHIKGIVKDAVREALSESQSLLDNKQANFDKLNRGELLTIDEAAELLSLSKSTIYQKVSQGKFNTYGGGKRIFLKSSELKEWLQQNRSYSKRHIESNSIEKFKERRADK